MSFRTTNFDALATAAPLNREAAAVRDGSGDLWEPKLYTPPPRWDAPPPAEAERPWNCEDLAGLTVGRLTVIRYHGTRKATGALWLCRCACGTYEARKTKALKRPHPDACCQACEYLKHLQYRAAHPTTDERRRAERLALDELAAKAREGSHA